MPTDHLRQYRGPLTLEQITVGINAALRQARILSADAKVLYEARSFGTAASLAILSLEELGKPGILRGLVGVTDPAELRRTWRRYRRHIDKNHLALLMPEYLEEARKNRKPPLRAYSAVFSSASEDVRSLYEALKQVGFYTDCLGDVHWTLPEEAIEQLLALQLLSLCETAVASHEIVTVREMQLWAAHVRDASFEGLRRWAIAMENEGLKPEGFAEKFCQFVGIDYSGPEPSK